MLNHVSVLVRASNQVYTGDFGRVRSCFIRVHSAVLCQQKDFVNVLYLVYVNAGLPVLSLAIACYSSLTSARCWFLADNEYCVGCTSAIYVLLVLPANLRR